MAMFCLLMTLFLGCCCSSVKTDKLSDAVTILEASQQKTNDLLNGTLVFQKNLLASQTQAVILQNKALILQEKDSASGDDILVLLKKTVTLLEKNEQHLQNIEALLAASSATNQLVMTTQQTELPPAKNCQDLAARGINSSGPYVITPPDGLGSLEVYCDFMDNEGWIVFHRRFSGQVDFFRDWYSYEYGFGNVSGEYWLGLKNIHRLVRDNSPWALHIDLEAFDGEFAYAVYDTFNISDAASNYRLSFGEYHGTSGDSLNYAHFDGTRMLNGRPFSTNDRANDAYSSNGDTCADRYKGAWWYNRCMASNLNGEYLGSTGNSPSGMVWYTWKVWQALKSSQMKIRRVQ